MDGKDIDMRKSVVGRWAGYANHYLKKQANCNDVLPNCYGHMHGMCRWINADMSEEDLKANAEKVAICHLCKFGNECAKRSVVSYTFQAINRDKGLIDNIIEAIADNG